MKREVNYKFAVTDVQKIQLEEYSEQEFSVARMGFLSTRPNAHGLVISEDVLRECASSVLGKWLVVDMTSIVDAGTHTKNEHIVGRIPKGQEVEFVEDEDGYLRAYVDVIISKIYGKDFVELFENDNNRAVSVEMTVECDEEDETLVLSFNIVGVTVLGKLIKPSCPQSDITITRFSLDKAETQYDKIHSDSFTTLKEFSEKRKQKMAESKTYKIDKSKKAMSDKAWGDVDKNNLRNKIMEAKNKTTLVKAVYMLVEDGWEEAPSEHLKYPVMELKGDTFVYNKGGLSSALGYAKKENETTVVNKIDKIYKNLGLDQDGKEADAKMAEIKFAAVNIGDMWNKMWDALHAKYPDGDWGSIYRIDGIYEEDNKKFAIIHHKDEDAKYRLDFSLTEEGLTLAEEIVKVELEIVETDEVKKFAEPENADKYKKFEDKDDKGIEMSADEMKAEMARMKSEIEDRDNIIMEKDKKMVEQEKELAELREFKAGVEKKEITMSVEALMSDVKACMSEDSFKSFREEGLKCNMSELDAWKNKVKAVAFEGVKKTGTKDKDGVWTFSAPITTEPKKSDDLWERLANR